MTPQLYCPAGLAARASRRGLLAGLLVVAAALVAVGLVWDARTALVAVVAVWAVWMGVMPVIVIRRARATRSTAISA
jgi:hypothetical protein